MPGDAQVSARAAELVLQARRHVHARWERMVADAAADVSGGAGGSSRSGGGAGASGARTKRREGWTGRFSGQPLLDGIAPLLQLRAQPAEPPKGLRGRGAKAGRRAAGGAPAPVAPVKKGAKRVFGSPRRKRSRMARYKKAW